MKNSHNIPPSKFICSNAANSIYCDSNYGPVFGGGNDICIYNQSNTHNSGSSFPHSYTDTTGKGDTLFAGQRTFMTLEIEVLDLIEFHFFKQFFDQKQVVFRNCQFAVSDVVENVAEIGAISVDEI